MNENNLIQYKQTNVYFGSDRNSIDHRLQIRDVTYRYKKDQHDQ